jgi:hypothetical protein
MKKFRRGQVAYIDIGFIDSLRIGYYWGVRNDFHVFAHKKEDAFKKDVLGIMVRDLEVAHLEPLKGENRLFTFSKYEQNYRRTLLLEVVSISGNLELVEA